MFKDFEDYVIAAAAVYFVVVVGNEIKKGLNEVDQMKRESSNEWDTWTLDRYTEVGHRLNKLNASHKARIEAFEHCHMLIEKQIAFYETNYVARDKALAFNNEHCTSLCNIWKRA